MLISGGKEPSLDNGIPAPIQARLTDEHDNIPFRVAQASREPVQANGPVERQFQPPAFVNDLFSLPGFLALPPNFCLKMESQFEHGIYIMCITLDGLCLVW